jgi:hypothetical protein
MLARPWMAPKWLCDLLDHGRDLIRIEQVDAQSQ